MKSNKLREIFLLWILLLFLVACAEKEPDSVLIHPAVSLIETQNELALLEPSWSPDNNLLAVTGLERCLTGHCNFGIFILNPHTNELSSVKEVDNQSLPAWTTDANVLSFTDGGSVYTIDLSEDSQEFVTLGSMTSWSSDGRYVAVTQIRGPTPSDNHNRPTISILELVTGREYQIFEVPEDTEENVITGLAWAPDSNRLAFSASWWTTEKGYTGGLFLINVDGSGLRQVAEKMGQPGWMPNGEWLYFITDEGKLGFAPLDFSCIITPLDIEGIGSAVISPFGNQMALEYQAKIYLLDLDQLLGSEREILAC